jgi:carboxymethylenebutenolidase
MRIRLSTGTPAEVAVPPDGDPQGGLIIWPDIFGLRPVFDDHCERLARTHGWAVCAIELYPGDEDMAVEDRHERARSFDDADKLADAEAAADACGVDNVSVMGFCMGGMYAMKTLASPRFRRAAAFYGMVRVPEGWRGGGQGDAIDVVRRRPRDLLAVFGTDDPWCPAEHIAEIEALGAATAIYPGAGHGWAQDPTRETYRPVDAADAWARAESFLASPTR